MIKVTITHEKNCFGLETDNSPLEVLGLLDFMRGVMLESMFKEGKFVTEKEWKKKLEEILKQQKAEDGHA